MLKTKSKTDVVRLAYSIQGAADATSNSAETIYRALVAGLIKGVRMGRVWRIPATEVERVVVEGIPPIPRHSRVTTGPTTRGRPAKIRTSPSPRRPSGLDQAEAVTMARAKAKHHKLDDAARRKRADVVRREFADAARRVRESESPI